MAVLGDEPSRFLNEHMQEEVIITKCLIQRDRHTVEPYDFFNARSAVEASVDASSRGRRRETEAATAVRVRRTKAKHANALMYILSSACTQKRPHDPARHIRLSSPVSVVVVFILRLFDANEFQNEIATHKPLRRFRRINCVNPRRASPERSIAKTKKNTPQRGRGGISSSFHASSVLPGGVYRRTDGRVRARPREPTFHSKVDISTFSQYTHTTWTI